jgi:hypothetical protein
MIQDCLCQINPGPWMEMGSIDRLYVVMVYLTSGITFWKLAVFFKISLRIVQNDVLHWLHELIQPLTQRFLPDADASYIQPVAIFADFPNAFGVV